MACSWIVLVALVYFANGAYSQWAPNFSQWSKDTTQTGETVAYDQHYVLDGFTTVSNFAEFETSSDILTSSGFSKSVVGSRPVSAASTGFTCSPDTRTEKIPLRPWEVPSANKALYFLAMAMLLSTGLAGINTESGKAYV